MSQQPLQTDSILTSEENVNIIRLPKRKGLPETFDRNRRLRFRSDISSDTPSIYSGSKISQLYKVKYNQLIMLNVRGYDVSSELGKFLDVDQFRQFYLQIKQIRNSQLNRKINFKEALSADYVHKTTERIIHVIYIDTPVDGGTTKAIKANQIRKIIEDKMYSPNQHIMLITETTLTSAAIKGLDLPSYTIEIFSYNQLEYNPNDHYLVPKHILLTDDQTEDLFRDQRLKASQLPLIASDDPIVRFHGAKPGQIFQINRIKPEPEALVKKMIVYRMVSEEKINP